MAAYQTYTVTKREGKTVSISETIFNANISMVKAVNATTSKIWLYDPQKVKHEELEVTRTFTEVETDLGTSGAATDTNFRRLTITEIDSHLYPAADLIPILVKSTNIIKIWADSSNGAYVNYNMGDEVNVKLRRFRTLEGPASIVAGNYSSS